MSDDKEPQGPFNPFIRFKNHVNARIGSGVSVFTGNTEDRDKSVGDTQNGSAHNAQSSSPCPARNRSPGGFNKKSAMMDYWDDWCHVDPYSPHNLRNLPQPTPNDLPPGVDPADFGFPEAFEDLMSTSNPFRGHLMDLRMRAGLKRTASGGLVTPETPSAWVRRLYGDALLPPPFIWEQPRLAGGFPNPWASQTRAPFETPHRAGHEHDPAGDIARAFLDTIRRIDEIAGGSFSDIEEAMGRDVAEMMRKAQKFAEKALSAFVDERSEDHDSGSSHAKTHGDARPASASEEDQPATEEDLFEMIQSASAEADKFLNNFLKDSARQTPPPAESPPRDDPPVSETVEHDPSGGKTIRTSSEHVDMFGFIHSKTEVRRLNAKGETVDYDTRYSVRSGPRGDRPPQPEYQPRSNAPVSVLMTPDQYSAFIGKSSDEQLESFRISTAEADEAGLDPENLALKNQQLHLILQEQRRRAELRDARANNPALQDYQRQLILLEEQNRKRREFRGSSTAGGQAPSSFSNAPVGEEHSPQWYEEALKRLEEQGRERLRRAREEHSAPGSNQQTLQSYQAELMRLEEQNKERLMEARQEEEAARRPPSDKPQVSTSSERSGWFWR